MQVRKAAAPEQGEARISFQHHNLRVVNKKNGACYWTSRPSRRGCVRLRYSLHYDAAKKPWEQRGLVEQTQLIAGQVVRLQDVLTISKPVCAAFTLGTAADTAVAAGGIGDPGAALMDGPPIMRSLIDLLSKQPNVQTRKLET